MKQSTLSALIFIFKGTRRAWTTMNQKACALTSFHGYCGNVELWEPTRTLSGFTAYCFCCNYNRKKDVSAQRSNSRGALHGALVMGLCCWRGACGELVGDPPTPQGSVCPHGFPEAELHQEQPSWLVQIICVAPVGLGKWKPPWTPSPDGVGRHPTSAFSPRGSKCCGRAPTRAANWFIFQLAKRERIPAAVIA